MEGLGKFKLIFPFHQRLILAKYRGAIELSEFKVTLAARSGGQNPPSLVARTNTGGSPFRVPNEVAARVNSFWFRKLSTEKLCYIVAPKDVGNESFFVKET